MRHTIISLLALASLALAACGSQDDHDDTAGAPAEAFSVETPQAPSEQPPAPVTPPEREPRLEAPERVDFGRTPIGQIATRTITVHNRGDQELVLDFITWLTPPRRSFSASYPSPDAPDDPRRDRATAPSSIAAGGSILIRLTHSPAGDRDVTRAVLRIGSGGPTPQSADIEVLGDSSTPCMQLGGADAREDLRDATHLLDFGPVSAGARSRRTIQIHNCSRRTNLDILPIELLDPDPQLLTAHEPRHPAHRVARLRRRRVLAGRARRRVHHQPARDP